MKRSRLPELMTRGMMRLVALGMRELSAMPQAVCLDGSARKTSGGTTERTATFAPAEGLTNRLDFFSGVGRSCVCGVCRRANVLSTDHHVYYF